MRAPDLTGMLTDDSPALAYRRIVPQAVARLAEVWGVEADPRELELPEIDYQVRAWRVAAKGSRPDHDASVGAWFVNGPFHVAWQWWMLGCVDLFPIEGAPPAHKQYPQAEYEILIFSLDPAKSPPPLEKAEAGNLTDGWGGGEGIFLTPADLVFQFHGVSREEARSVLEWMIERIMAGKMSPDSDYRSAWKSMLGVRVNELGGGCGF